MNVHYLQRVPFEEPGGMEYPLQSRSYRLNAPRFHDGEPVRRTGINRRMQTREHSRCR